MIYDSETATATVKFLLQIKAIQLQPKNPFTWSSGWQSPIYCDNRLSLSFPAIRNYIKDQLSKVILDKYGKPDVIAGVATGAIAIGVLVAQELGIPFVYVRPKVKGHGKENQIEGHLESGSNIVVIEDLISTGESSINAVKALNMKNISVKGLVSIFTYGFKESEERLEKEKLDWITLSNYEYLLAEALKSDYISENEMETLKDWKKNPSEWKGALV